MPDMTLSLQSCEMILDDGQHKNIMCAIIVSFYMINTYEYHAWVAKSLDILQ